LVFWDEKGDAEILVYDNVRGIYKAPWGYVAITGLGGGDIGHGLIYSVRNANGRWEAKESFRLYNPPDDIEQLKDGSLIIINMFGSFLLKENHLCRIDRDD
jgi:hypothetical protein